MEESPSSVEGVVIRRLFAPLSAVILLLSVACSDLEKNENTVPTPPEPVQYTFVKFDVSTGNPADIAIPNDILRNPFTGQVAIPLTGEPYDSLNSLYGFSTLAPMVIPFVGEVDPASVSAATMPVVNTTTFQPAPCAYQVTTNPETGNSTVGILPLVPLAAGTTHVVVVTKGVLGLPSHRPVESEILTILLKGTTPFVDGSGHSTRGALDDATAAALEPLRAAYQNIWGAAEAITQQGRLDIPFAFAFTTQPLASTAQVLRARAQSETPTPTILTALPSPAAVDAFFQSLGLGAVPHAGIGALYYGSFNAPNYINHPLAGPFNGEGEALTPAGRNDITFWAALPAGASGPVPAVIFQHGLTRTKEDMLAIANGACANGIAMIGIDVVLHGDRAGDFINNSTGEFGPDGIQDPSGTFFLNVANPRMARDNARQTLSDQFMLARMISSGAADFNGDSIPEIAPIGMTYIGQSLGALLGSAFVTLEPNVALGALNVPGGRVGSLVPNSPTISQAVNAGLAAAGVLPGTPDYALFFLVFQTVMDDADPMNYVPYLTNGGLAGGVGSNALVQEMFNDQVVPNSATFDLVRAMHVPQVNASWVYPGQEQVSAPHIGSGHYQFNEGGHGFLLDPTAPTIVQGQTQALTYLFTGLQGQPTIIDPFGGNKNIDIAYVEDMPYRFGFEINLDTLVYFPTK